jgi:hypothetical protein
MERSFERSALWLWSLMLRARPSRHPYRAYAKTYDRVRVEGPLVYVEQTEYVLEGQEGEEEGGV